MKLLSFICALWMYFPVLAQAVDDLGDSEAIENELDGQEDDGSTAPNADATLSPEPPPSEAPAAEPTRSIVEEPERPSSTPGEKIFDWDKHRGEREVHHPFAEKGLVRITKDKTYLYKTSESEQNRAADFHVGSYNPTELSNPKGEDGSAGYLDNYQGAAPAILANYEWQMKPTAIGRFGWRAGGGLFISQGNGHFVTNNGKKPLEVFTFAAIPLSVGVVYRLQLWHRQLIVPYGEGGGTLWAFGELRDDNKSPKFGGAPAAYVAAGAAINMTYFNALSRVALDREYGINSIYILAEYRGIIGLSNNYNFTSNLINGGVLMEF